MARSGSLWAGLVFGGAALGAVIATAYFVANNHPVTHDDMCVVTASDGATFARTAEQANYAALIGAVPSRRGMGTDASIVGLATAMQESGLRNLDYGDRDSLGLFQQRPSQGWGTAEQVQDPYYASLRFYRGLSRIDGWQDMRVTEAAQTVQGSAYPEAYEKHVPEATAWANAIRGETPFAAVDCDLDAATTTSSAQAFAKRLQLDYGQNKYVVTVVGRNDRAVLLGVTAVSGERKDLDAVANWSVAVADAQSVASVRLDDVEWLREQGVAPSSGPPGYDGVLVGVVTTVAD